MIPQPDEGGPASAPRSDRVHDELLVLNLNLVAGFGLVVPVLGLQTGQWPNQQALLSITALLASALAWIGIGHAAWRKGWRRAGVLVLALAAIAMGMAALFIMTFLLMLGPAFLDLPELGTRLAAMIRANVVGWLALVCALVSVVVLARSLRRRGRGTAATFCIILAATLLLEMVVLPAVPWIMWSLSMMH